MAQITRNLAITLAVCCVIEKLALSVAADVTSTPPITTTDAKTKAFVAAIESCSSDCQLQIGACLNSAPSAQALWTAERYCDLLNYKEDGTTSYDCLVKTKYCTDVEYKKLEHAACGALSIEFGLSPIAISFISLLLRKNL